jgi:hypothetical protein
VVFRHAPDLALEGFPSLPFAEGHDAARHWRNWAMAASPTKVRQRAALRAAGYTRLFEEKASGGRGIAPSCIACSTIFGMATW